MAQTRNQTRAKLDAAGRIVIPAKYRKLLGVKPGDEILLREEKGDIRIINYDAAIRRVQKIAKRHIPASVDLAAELIADRRREGRRRG